MSSPFAALGLDEDADERAVKRAYAQRLKSARPDEDAEAFQSLNGAYKAALAAVRWRTQAEVEAVDDGAPGEAPSNETEAPLLASELPPRHETVPEAPAPEPDGDLPFGYATPRDDGGIEFDFDAFSAALFEVAADPAADLAAWLRHETADWPLAMKPTLAPYLLHAFDEGGIVVPPDHFATLVAAFGLDDVLSGVDPVAVERLRKDNERRSVKGEAIERARRLLAPGNRRELDKAVRVGGYMPFAAPILASLVTGPGARRRTGLRWVPLLARWVMNLLRYVSANTVDALSPPIDPAVLARWTRAYRTIGRLRARDLLSLLFVVGFAGAMVYAMLQPPGIDDILKEEHDAPDKAIADYAAFIRDNSPPKSAEATANVAIAMFNRGTVLMRLERWDESLAAFTELTDRFSGSDDRDVRHTVAQGLVNIAWVDVQKGAYKDAIAVGREVVDRYGGANDEAQGEDSFDLQVVKALNIEADAMSRLGGGLAAATLCQATLDRFANATSDAMKQALDETRETMREGGTSAAASPEVPEPTPLQQAIKPEPRREWTPQ